MQAPCWNDSPFGCVFFCFFAFFLAFHPFLPLSLSLSLSHTHTHSHSHSHSHTRPVRYGTTRVWKRHTTHKNIHVSVVSRHAPTKHTRVTITTLSPVVLWFCTILLYWSRFLWFLFLSSVWYEVPFLESFSSFFFFFLDVFLLLLLFCLFVSFPGHAHTHTHIYIYIYIVLVRLWPFLKSKSMIAIPTWIFH